MQQTLWNHNHKSCRERPPQSSQSSLGRCGQKRWCSASHCYSCQIIIFVSSPISKGKQKKTLLVCSCLGMLRKYELFKHQCPINPWRAVWVEHVGCNSAGTGFLDEGWQQQHHWWRKSMMLKAWASPKAPKRLSCSGWPRRSSPLKRHQYWWALLQHHPSLHGHPLGWAPSLAIGCAPCKVPGVTREGTAPRDAELPQGYSSLLLTVHAPSHCERLRKK